MANQYKVVFCELLCIQVTVNSLSRQCVCMHACNNSLKYHKLEYIHHSNKEEIINLGGAWRVEDKGGGRGGI